MTQETLKELPKIELHCHLDGSLSRPFIEKRLGRTVRPEELSVSENCTSLNEYLENLTFPADVLWMKRDFPELRMICSPR